MPLSLLPGFNDFFQDEQDLVHYLKKVQRKNCLIKTRVIHQKTELSALQVTFLSSSNENFLLLAPRIGSQRKLVHNLL